MHTSSSSPTPESPVGPIVEQGRLPSRPDGLRVAAIVVVIVVLAELAVRLAAPHLQSPLVWGDWQTQNKATRVAQLADHGGASVVLVGSSMMNADVDPVALTAALDGDRPAFNAALDGAEPRGEEPWALGLLLPKLRPDTVVIGLSSRDLNDNGLNQQAFYSTFAESLRGGALLPDRTLMNRLTSSAAGTSALFRYRTVLREPTQMMGKGTGVPDDRSDRLGTAQTAVSQLDLPYQVSRQFVQRQYDMVLNDYVIGKQELAALNRLIRGVTDVGARVVLVVMPITRDAMGLHPNGVDDYRAFLRAVESTAAAHHIDLVRLDGAITDSAAFRDPYHLNRRGRTLFTDILAKVVRGPGGCCEVPLELNAVG